jgi:hypothetical protein
VKVLTKKEIIVDLDRPEPGAEQQTLTFRLPKKTKFLKSRVFDNGDRASAAVQGTAPQSMQVFESGKSMRH